MATRKRSVNREPHEFSLVCKGVSQEEFLEIRDGLQAELGASIAFRNPFIPEFDAKTIHEIIVHIGENGAVIYTAKKALDGIIGVVKRKLEERDADKRRVIIPDGNGRPVVEIEVKPDKPKRKR